MKLLLVGGHLTPALAVLDMIRKQETTIEPIFVGRLVSQKEHQQPAREKREVEARDVKFIPFSGPKVSQIQAWWKQLGLPFSLLNSTRKALKLIAAEQPTVILSFGGYLAVPLALAAKLKGLSIVTHEQTRAPGLANKIIARLADKIALTWPETKDSFPSKKTVVTGNPVRPEVLSQPAAQPSWLTKKPTRPILLIMGGSQGSRKINQIVKKVLPVLLKKWTVVHLTGQVQNETQDHYYALPWVSGGDLAWLYTQAQAAISRAGANTSYELTVRQVPSLYIPLPFARHQEQLKNATWLVERGAALLLPQARLNQKNLLQKVGTLKKERAAFMAQLEKISLPLDGAQQLIKVVHAITTDET